MKKKQQREIVEALDVMTTFLDPRKFREMCTQWGGNPKDYLKAQKYAKEVLARAWPAIGGDTRKA